MYDIHPAPVYSYRADHREAHNREQLRYPSEYQSIWKRVVEGLAEEMQIEPIEAHFLLEDATAHITKGIAWAWWT